MADEMYKFKATLTLPKSLNQCRQDVDSHQINVTHRFKLMVNIHNPEGHISQLVCRLPVKLFISPNLPVDESNEVSGVYNGITDAEINENETNATAPPEYGRHMLDQIFSDIDPSGFMSRAGSAPGTPGGLYAQSRRGSQENIASLNGIAAEGLTTPLDQHGSALPSILHSRLADLQERNSSHASRTPPNRSASHTTSHSPSGGTSPAPGLIDTHSPERGFRPTSMSANGGYFSAVSQSPSTSAPMSRRQSNEQDESNVHQADYDLNDLSRVPSYGAALRTPGAVTPFSEGELMQHICLGILIGSNC